MSPVVLRRLRVKNYKSLRGLDIALQPLAIFIGPNGAGKSNILDVIRFVSDALQIDLDFAIRQRGGINEVRRRSSGRPNNFGFALDLELGDLVAHYAFTIEAMAGQSYRVAHEVCTVASSKEALKGQTRFKVERGKLLEGSESLQAAVSEQDLYLRRVSGERGFDAVFEALRSFAIYNPNPEVMRDHLAPDPARLLRRDGSNIPSLLRRLEMQDPARLERISAFLGTIVPGVVGVQHEAVQSRETIVFRQRMDNQNKWRFSAQSMSDGTLRALGILGAVFQPEVRFAGVEEPEVALHPGAARVLADALAEASATVQIAVTTHSPDLLEHEGLDIDAFYAVHNYRGITYAAPVDDAAKSLVREGLFTPGELLRMGQLEFDNSTLGTSASRQVKLFS